MQVILFHLFGLPQGQDPGETCETPDLPGVFPLVCAGCRGGFGGFGGRRRSGDWLMRVMQAIEDHNWAYTAWDLHPSAGPTLISGWDYTPSPFFGVYVKQMLAGTLPRYTPPAPAEASADTSND